MSNESKTTQPDASLPAIPNTMATGARQDALPMEDDADLALVQRCRRGETEAFGQLVARHDTRVYALVARILGAGATAEDVDDVAQDIFVQAWRALPKFRGDARFSTWLYRIATNMAIKQWHRIKRRAQTISEEEMPEAIRASWADPAPGPSEAAALRERDRALRGAIDRLPEKQRTVVLLHYFEGCSCEEAAALLNCSVGTVWSRLHYACRKLRGLVGWLEEA